MPNRDFDENAFDVQSTEVRCSKNNDPPPPPPHPSTNLIRSSVLKDLGHVIVDTIRSTDDDSTPMAEALLSPSFSSFPVRGHVGDQVTGESDDEGRFDHHSWIEGTAAEEEEDKRNFGILRMVRRRRDLPPWTMSHSSEEEKEEEKRPVGLLRMGKRPVGLLRMGKRPLTFYDWSENKDTKWQTSQEPTTRIPETDLV